MMLRGIDSHCTRLTLAVVAISSRLSWRLSRTLHAVATSAHDAILVGGRRTGIPYVPSRWIDRSMAGKSLDGPALYPAMTLLEEDVASHIASLRRGFWNPDESTPFRLEETGWTTREETGHSNQARFLWHVLHPVAILVAAHQARLDSLDLERAMVLARRWITSCLYREGAESVWSDHVTAMRALVLCDLWNTLRQAPNPDPKALRELGSALARHAERLVLSRFYRSEHNHGVTQGYALLALASVLCGHPSAGNWSRLACARLEAQMAQNVSREGVHREHSPYYHFFVLCQFQRASHLAMRLRLPLSVAYQERLQRMLEAGISMIEPAGTLVPLGDTWHGAPILISDRDLESYPSPLVADLRSAMSSTESRAPSCAALFRGGGMAVLRSGPQRGEDPRDERYVAVRLSVFPTSHIHRDALAFTLSAYGTRLLVDSGGPYGYGSELRRRYFTTTAAHNTVVVDSGSQAPGPCRVLRWETQSEMQLLEAEHHNYPGVLHRRSLILVRGRYLLVIDRLQSRSPHHYRQCFHFSPDFVPRLTGWEALASHADGQSTLRLIPLLHEGEAPELHQGGEEPIHSWICTGEVKRLPTWIASHSLHGSDADFATLIVPGRGPEPPKVTVVPLPSSTPGTARVRIELEGCRMQLHVNVADSPVLVLEDA